MMKRILTIALASMMMFSATAFASIHRSIDNYQCASIYHTSKKVDYFSYSTILDITKTARQDNNNLFVLRVTYSGPGMHKAVINNDAAVIIDGMSYPVERLVHESSYSTKIQRGRTFADFIVSPEVCDKISKFNKYCWFQFSRQGKKPNVIKMSPYEQEEVRLIAKLRYEDFEALESGKLKPIDPDAPKPVLTFKERLKLKMQEATSEK